MKNSYWTVVALLEPPMPASRQSSETMSDAFVCCQALTARLRWSRWDLSRARRISSQPDSEKLGSIATISPLKIDWVERWLIAPILISTSLPIASDELSMCVICGSVIRIVAEAGSDRVSVTFTSTSALRISGATCAPATRSSTPETWSSELCDACAGISSPASAARGRCRVAGASGSRSR